MRIISGTHRGRRVKAPKGMSTRPTTDRVREALFSILGPLDGLTVVDCYAGSGALGFEALSRGARHVTFIESGRAACQVLKSNAEHLQLSDRCTIVQREVQRCSGMLQELDLVLSDPPWPISDRAAGVVARVLAQALKPEARVVLGHPNRVSLPDQLQQLQQIDRRNWGDSAMSFFTPAAETDERAASAAPGAESGPNPC